VVRESDDPTLLADVVLGLLSALLVSNIAATEELAIEQQSSE